MGERFGEYELIRKIATGGMAEIYLARHGGVEGFSRRVVVKRMLPQLAVRDDFVQMFLDEARLAANLVHPNIVQVFNLGEVDDSYFMAMELIDGPHLGALFAHSLRQRRPLPIELCVYIVARASDGLDYAHDHVDPSTGQRLNIVHRDISPQNVLVSRHGDVKVTDFGVAKAETQQTKTRTGIIKGKVSYMSPEQCLGETVDRRTDVFALGVVLYELLTRRRLYRDKSDLLIMQRITTEELKPPSATNPGVDGELDRIALTALAKKKGERYQNAGELSEALDVWLALKGHTDCRSQLQRWMSANADGLGIGAGEESSSPSSPSWSPGAASPSGEARGAGQDDGDDEEGTVSTPALSSEEADPEPLAARAGPPSGPTLIVAASDVEESLEATAIEGVAAVSLDVLPSAPEGAPPPSVSDTQLMTTLPPALLDDLGPPERLANERPAPSRRLPIAALGGGIAAVLVAVVALVAVGGSEDTEAATPVRDPVVVDRTADPASDPPSAPDPRPVPEQAALQPSAPSKDAGAAAAVNPPAEPPPRVATLARVRVSTQPTAVPVMVNGKVVGTSPVEIEVEPGSAEVAAIFPDQKPVSRRLKVEAGKEATLSLLARVPLTVRSTPSGADISVDGEAWGTTPKQGLWLDPGKRVRVTLSKSGYLPWSGEIKPVAGKPVVVTEELRRRPSAASTPPRSSTPVGEGKVRVDCRPWANVYINGRQVGVTPTSPIELKVGRHRVKVVNQELGFSKSTVVEVKKDATVTVGFKFKKEGDRWVFDTVVK